MHRAILIGFGLMLAVSVGRSDEMNEHAAAAVRFDAQLKANPADVDAAFNAGQAYYNLGKMELALERWKTAQRLAPGDFDIAKKVLQATYGAGHAETAAAHERVIAVWNSSTNPRIKGLREFVFDQFRVGGTLTMAYETLAPQGDLYDVYNFKFLDSGNKVVGVVHLESSRYGRETGVPYVVAITTAAGHRTKNIMFKSMPPYAELKRVVAQLAVSDFGLK